MSQRDPASASSDAIVARGLTKSFGSTQVLRGVDLAVGRGTMLGLLGPNGAGKTTTVRILSTLMRPDAGTARIGGHDVTRDPAEVHRILGLTGQDTSVDGLLTGRENLVMLARLYHLTRRDAKRRAAQLLEQFDLVDAADRAARTYSGGMRRRLDLAASLIASPPIVFLDEPTTGLDPSARRDMWEVIRRLMDEGTTILLTTQYLEEADQLANHVAVIDHGRVIAEGSSAELKRQVGTELVQLTLHDAASLASAQALLAGSATHVDEQARLMTLPMDGPRQLRGILNRLDDAGLDVAELSVTRPTLDDVFFAVTGHPTADDRLKEAS